ncbi:cancer/testis antigen 55-like [Lepus europaeus]|uniref:cancer/testis antigen 55-like n=1 Tax=Lepus europaeus TaxID=9983 RepID=UPI002B4A3C8E|nr:cancer/testis antigen 55-like [Lepus europaeus]
MLQWGRGGGSWVIPKVLSSIVSHDDSVAAQPVTSCNSAEQIETRRRGSSALPALSLRLFIERHLCDLRDDRNLENRWEVVPSSSYGVTDESLHFNTDEVGRVMLRGGQKSTADNEESEPSEELKPFQVDAIAFDVHFAGQSDLQTRILIGCVTAIKKGVVYVNETIKCSLDNVTEGFVPYNGDWLEVEYSVQPGTWKIRAHSAKPLTCKHVEKVRITNVNGRNGVIDHTTFFTLDSVKLPDGYMPQIHDVVNAVVVESVLAGYICRAVLITPCE